MMNYKNIFVYLLLSLTLGLASCSKSNKVIEKIEISPLGIENPSEALMDLIIKNGDYINASGSPYLLDVSQVYYNKDKYLWLDIRTQADYKLGHIDGAIRVERKNLFKAMKKNHAENYSKVIIIDNTGLESAYAASTLRAMGYTNCFPLKFGMAVWNPKFANAWTSVLKSPLSGNLETKENIKGKKTKLPAIKVKATTASGILKERALEIIDDNFMVTAEKVMANADDYYIINYWPKAKYKAGHLEGAQLYAPKTSLKLKKDLLTIPTNKKVAIYCYTGSSASAVTAYLRLLGYDAYAISYGANGFMYSHLKAKNIHAFDMNAKGNNFPITTGPKASIKKELKGTAAVAAPVAPIVKRAKKEAGGGGCD